MKPESPILPRLFSLIAGAFMAIALTKFSNPAILDQLSVPPKHLYEVLYGAWPLGWGYCLLLGGAAAGLLAADWRLRTPKWVWWLPLLWLGWQFVSASRTVDPKLTALTLKYFIALAICFYFGLLSLGRDASPWPLWTMLSMAFIWIVYFGFGQHFGGLEDTRRYLYAQPGWQNLPEEFLRRVQSNRIYSTLFYPNTLAAALLLLMPIVLAFLWSLDFIHRSWRLAAVGLAGCAGLACLYWSGSKGGWLIMLLLGVIAFWHSPTRRGWKIGLTVFLLAIGLSGFGIRYAQFFRGGSTSVVARLDYWNAAITVARQHPVLGSGPGTFGVTYSKLRRPNAEMAKLVHNDYLEQASDSGIIGFLAYSAFIAGSLTLLYRYSFSVNKPARFMSMAVFLGLLGVSVHCLVEFNIYVPAIGFVYFLLLGWLWRSSCSALGQSTEKNGRGMETSKNSTKQVR